MAWTDELDPYFARLWSEFAGGLAARRVLDTRTRLLVSIGECVVIGETREVARLVEQALVADVPAAEIHEVMLQACVYAGRPIVNRSLDVFADVLEKTGRMAELMRARLPVEGPNASRTIDTERLSWRLSDDEFPRREEFMRKYGWQGISAMLSTQPGHRAQGLQLMDSLDDGYTKLWVDFIYSGMYGRRVLDDKTRTLCMVGECIALQSEPQAENHMRNAMILGCTREEVLEVVFQSTQFVGMPRSLWGRYVLQKVLAERSA
jgi:alkylhydroperoxidase/carboxymuconolactone decarboxylase family protein YurZ